MSKKISLILFLIFLFTPRYFSFADIGAGMQINEIMYDLKTGSDDGREWVEVFNNSNVPVDISNYRFFENDTNHKLKLIQGDANIPPQGYAVIVSDPVKFKIDYPNFSGIIFDSAFSLNNTGEALAIKDQDLHVVDEYTYNSSTGGAGDGNSLQKINGAWIGALPTPGAQNIENKIILVPAPIQENKITTIAVVKNTPIPKIETKTIVPSPPVAGNLSANAISGDPSVKKINTFAFIFIGVLIFGGGAVYFIRKNKIIPKSGDEFEILDE